MKLSDYVARFVANLGVKHVFMLPGGGAMHLNDSFGHFNGIECVSNHHEQACAFAAETYSKVTGNIGVALVTTGPGGTNAITGLAGAWLDSTPCLFISGQVKRSDLIGDLKIRQHGVQEIDIISIVRPITKYAVTVMQPERIRYHLEKAVDVARNGHPGPVWIDIPLDVQATTIDPDTLTGYKSDIKGDKFRKEELSALVSQAISLLNESKRPLFLLGNGIRLSGALGEAQELMATLELPFLLTWPAMDFFPDSHELLVGRPGPLAPRGANFALQNADFLLTIGARLDMATTGYAHKNFACAAKKVMVDIDPNEIGKMNTHLDVPVCADAGAFIMEFLSQANDIEKSDRSEWINRCQLWKIKYPLVNRDDRPLPYVSTYHLTDVLSDVLTGEDLIISGSSGNGIEIFLLAFRPKRGQRVLCTAALGAMGTGLPASIGGCLASGGKRTICVNGDGGLQLNIQEFETLAQLDLPVKLFVLNNQGYGSIRASQSTWFGRLTGADSTSGLSLPDITRIAAAYNLKVKKITGSDDITTSVREVLSEPGPVICEVMTPPDELKTPVMKSVQTEDGSMVSKPIEDLWPFLDREEFLENMITDKDEN